ncbi:MAG: hypothetical protein ACI9VR_000459, partial [Cognaticolwellia sp.]
LQRGVRQAWARRRLPPKLARVVQAACRHRRLAQLHTTPPIRVIQRSVVVGCTDIDDGLDTGFLDDTGDTGDFEECDVPVVAFDYGDQAPWIDNNPDCGGSAQSPIDLTTSLFVEGEAPILEFAYTTSPLNAVNKGHSIEYEVDLR